MSGAGASLVSIVLSPDEGERVESGGLGVRFTIEGGRTAAEPYTYVLEGEICFQVGDEGRSGREGDDIFKPRGVPHRCQGWG